MAEKTQAFAERKRKELQKLTWALEEARKRLELCQAVGTYVGRREGRGQSPATPTPPGQSPQVGSPSRPQPSLRPHLPRVRPSLPACRHLAWLAPGPISLPATATERTARAGALPPAGPLPPSSRSDEGVLLCLRGGIRHRDSWGQVAPTGFAGCQGHKPRAHFCRLKGPGTLVTAPKTEPKTQLLQATDKANKNNFLTMRVKSM